MVQYFVRFKNRNILITEDLNLQFSEDFFELLLDLDTVRIRSAIEKNSFGVSLLNELFQFPDRVTGAQDESTADGFQVVGQRPQTAAKEFLPVRTGPSDDAFFQSERM